MDVQAIPLGGGPEAVLLRPARPNGVGLLVLGGSSGRVETDRARLFAAAGVTAIAMRWFGGPGQSPGICEIPLETFAPAIDRLVAEGCGTLALLGTSKSAEAVLLTAIRDPRIDVVAAFSPSSVVWANSGPGLDGLGWPLRSSWTWQGRPLAFVPYDVENMPTASDGPVSYLAYHEASLAGFADVVPAAAIPIEQARAQVVLVGGEDDALWPSARFARELAARVEAAGRRAVLVTHPEAGHRVLLPGETTPRSTVNAHGGADTADAELGASAWRELTGLLGLET
jgi:acetyl esterase/lipase